MARTLLKAKGRRESGAFVPFPVTVLNHENFLRLSAKAVKLLLDLCAQLRFKRGGSVNNGDLCAALSVMQPRGWRSEETLQNALDELKHMGFVIRTRQGGRNRCSLYAVTWWAIDECDGKLDVAATRAPSNDWQNDRTPFVPRRKKNKAKKKSLPRKTQKITPMVGVIDNPNEGKRA
jgi:hypothetical protein